MAVVDDGEPRVTIDGFAEIVPRAELERVRAVFERLHRKARGGGEVCQSDAHVRIVINDSKELRLAWHRANLLARLEAGYWTLVQ